MRIISDYYNSIHINIILLVFLVVVINIVITMKVNRQIRYTSFLVYASYIMFIVLNVAVYITFTWYFAILSGMLITDIVSRWLKKEIAKATEEEQKGGYGLTKKIRDQQIHNYIMKASPVEMNRVKKYKENPVKFTRPMFMTVVNVTSILVAVAMILL